MGEVGTGDDVGDGGDDDGQGEGSENEEKMMGKIV